VSNLTVSRARELLSYDKSTGELRWLVSRSGAPRAGQIAGWLSPIRGNFYRYVMIDKQSYSAHRLAWLIVTGEWPEAEIDHINGDGADNRWSNLRQVSSSENRRNQRRRVTNKTGVIGVHWCKSSRVWRASIKPSGEKRQYLYNGKDFFEACCARKSAEVKYDFHPNHGMR